MKIRRYTFLLIVKLLINQSVLGIDCPELPLDRIGYGSSSHSPVKTKIISLSATSELSYLAYFQSFGEKENKTYALIVEELVAGKSKDKKVIDCFNVCYKDDRLWLDMVIDNENIPHIAYAYLSKNGVNDLKYYVKNHDNLLEYTYNIDDNIPVGLALDINNIPTITIFSKKYNHLESIQQTTNKIWSVNSIQIDMTVKEPIEMTRNKIGGFALCFPGTNNNSLVYVYENDSVWEVDVIQVPTNDIYRFKLTREYKSPGPYIFFQSSDSRINVMYKNDKDKFWKIHGSYYTGKQRRPFDLVLAKEGRQFKDTPIISFQNKGETNLMYYDANTKIWNVKNILKNTESTYRGQKRGYGMSLLNVSLNTNSYVAYYRTVHWNLKANNYHYFLESTKLKIAEK